MDQNEKSQTLRMKSVRMITHDLSEKVRKEQEEENKEEEEEEEEEE